METIIEKLPKEKSDLDKKITKLNDFIAKNEKYQSLSEMQQLLLVMQSKAMETYSDVLQARIIEME